MEVVTLLVLGSVLVVLAPLCRWAYDNNSTVFNTLAGLQLVAIFWAAMWAVARAHMQSCSV